MIGALVLYSSSGLVSEAVAVLLEGAPGDIDSVVTVHDLHVWTISSGMVSLSCHVIASDGAVRRGLLPQMKRMLEERFRIHHSTIQIEPEDFVEPESCG